MPCSLSPSGKVRAKAKFFYRATVLAWLEATAGWSPLKIAVGCRRHDVAKTALRLGQIDSFGTGVDELVAIASNPGTSRSGSLSTVSTASSWICVRMDMRGALPCPVLA